MVVTDTQKLRMSEKAAKQLGRQTDEEAEAAKAKELEEAKAARVEEKRQKEELQEQKRAAKKRVVADAKTADEALGLVMSKHRLLVKGVNQARYDLDELQRMETRLRSERGEAEAAVETAKAALECAIDRDLSARQALADAEREIHGAKQRVEASKAGVASALGAADDAWGCVNPKKRRRKGTTTMIRRTSSSHFLLRMKFQIKRAATKATRTS